METSAVRSLNGPTWRLRPGPGDPQVGHLVFLDHGRVPRRDEVINALDEAAELGFRAVRSSAMFPDAAAVVADLGFTVADRLALLRLDRLGERDLRGDVATRALRAWHRRSAAEIDRLAFGDSWGNDPDGLVEIERATPRHRSRWIGAGTDPIAFAISGASGHTGYLQRIAVAPTHHRRGLATSLVADALLWMQQLGAREVLVNTGVDNQAALALYERFGFARLTDLLTIAEFHFEQGDA